MLECSGFFHSEISDVEYLSVSLTYFAEYPQVYSVPSDDQDDDSSYRTPIPLSDFQFYRLGALSRFVCRGRFPQLVEMQYQ